jgi:hypothetical protein
LPFSILSFLPTLACPPGPTPGRADGAFVPFVIVIVVFAVVVAVAVVFAAIFVAGLADPGVIEFGVVGEIGLSLPSLPFPFPCPCGNRNLPANLACCRSVLIDMLRFVGLFDARPVPFGRAEEVWVSVVDPTRARPELEVDNLLTGRIVEVEPLVIPLPLPLGLAIRS